jgi:hypothetical protein
MMELKNVCKEYQNKYDDIKMNDLYALMIKDNIKIPSMGMLKVYFQ